MKQLLRKEALQATIPFAVLFSIASMIWIGSQRPESLLAPNIFMWVVLMATGAGTGALFGYLQFWGERRLRTLPYLVHRDGGHREAFRAKLIIGLCYSSGMLLGPPLVFLAWHSLNSRNAGIIPSARFLELGWLLPDAWLGYACGVLVSQLRRSKPLEAIGLLVATLGAMSLVLNVAQPVLNVPWRGALHALAGSVGCAFVVLVARRLFRGTQDPELPLARAFETAGALAFTVALAFGLPLLTNVIAQAVREKLQESLPKVVRIESSGAIRAIAPSPGSEGKTDRLALWNAVTEDGMPFEPLETTHYDSGQFTAVPSALRETRALFDLSTRDERDAFDVRMYATDVGLGFWRLMYEGGQVDRTRFGVDVDVYAWLNPSSGTIEAYWLAQDRVVGRAPVAHTELQPQPEHESFPGSLPLALRLTKPGGSGRFSPQTITVSRGSSVTALILDFEERTFWLFDPRDPAHAITPLPLPRGDHFVSDAFAVKRDEVSLKSWTTLKWVIVGTNDAYYWDGAHMQGSTEWNPDGALVVVRADEIGVPADVRTDVVDDDAFLPAVEVRDVKSGSVRLAHHFRATSVTQRTQLMGLDLLALCTPTCICVPAYFHAPANRAPTDWGGVALVGRHRAWLLIADVALSAMLAAFTWRRLTPHGASLPVRMAYASGAVVLGMPAALLLFMMVPRVRSMPTAEREPLRETVLLAQPA